MATVVLKNISKEYENGFKAVEDFNLSIEPGEFVALVGPSGCGKSTTLRMIAGLEDISDGELWIDGEIANFLEPKDRKLSMVFQNYALYPTMTIYKNIAFSLEIRGVKKKEVEKRVHEVAQLLEIENLLDRMPSEVSGGQRQRVAIGNAIIRNPQLLLMDEPLSNLDAKLRGKMRVELAKIHKRLGNTIIYVTHDQVEAMTLGTRIVVMNHGHIEQADTPAHLYDNPINKFVAGFLGTPPMNFVTADILDLTDNIALILDEGRLLCPPVLSDAIRRAGCPKTVLLGIRPEAMIDPMTREKKGIPDYANAHIRVHVTHHEFLGNQGIVYFDMGKAHCSAKVDPALPVKTGDPVDFLVDLSTIALFDPETDENLLYPYRKQQEESTAEAVS